MNNPYNKEDIKQKKIIYPMLKKMRKILKIQIIRKEPDKKLDQNIIIIVVIGIRVI